MMNQCNFIGRLSADPEVRYLQDGTAVANFTIACGEKWKDKQGQQQEKTEWVRIVAWRKLGEICGEYLTKGSMVFISGKMDTRKWDDQEGNTRYTTEIVAREMKMIGGRGDGGQQREPEPQPTQEEVPF
jgi:single-strand DNA-binding protein